MVPCLKLILQGFNAILTTTTTQAYLQGCKLKETAFEEKNSHLVSSSQGQFN